MSLETRSFRFGEFILDTKEKVLLRDGKPVSITPKASRLLELLLENHGHVVEKDQLMQTVWAGSFVEEGNIVFTVGMLRKALGDDKNHPRFIETVPRRGYRFIGKVEESSGNGAAPAGAVEAVPEPTNAKQAPVSRTRLAYLPALAVLLCGAAVIAGWYALSGVRASGVPLLNMPFASQKLSTTGGVNHAIISTDGKNVVYSNSAGGKQSIWLRQLESANNVEIIPPSDDLYYGLALSPDGNFLYFARRVKNVEGQADIYRVSIFGGAPVKIIGEAQGWISISPDGGGISFVRCYQREEDFCSLWVADAADGRNERKLASRARPIRIADIQFSPDGRSVAFAAGQSENRANEFGLLEVNLETGTERELTAQRFFNINSIAWLPNGRELLITASRSPDKNFLIWQVSSVTGDVTPLTNDSAYAALSVDKDGGRLVSTLVKQDYRLRLLQMNGPADATFLADAMSVAFARSGKVVFASEMSGNEEIWSFNQDGSEQRQLTNDPADDMRPIASADSRYYFFASNRSGALDVWRMNSDGSDQTQLTRTDGGLPIFASPDGQWVYYHHGLHRNLWRVSTKGGNEQLVLDRRSYRFAVSPEGSRVAFGEKQGEKRIVTIVSIVDRRTLASFPYADQQGRMIDVAWLPDGKNLAYVLADGEFQNNALWLHPLNAEPPRKVADLGDELVSESSGFAVSPDGKTFAVIMGGWKHDAILITGLK